MTVYFIRRNGDPQKLVKIGFTNNMRSRMSSLATGWPEGCEVLAVMPGGRETEKFLHALLSGDRDAGEWFRPSELLSSVISAASTTGEEMPEDPVDLSPVRPAPRLGAISAGARLGTILAHASDLDAMDEGLRRELTEGNYSDRMDTAVAIRTWAAEVAEWVAPEVASALAQMRKSDR